MNYNKWVSENSKKNYFVSWIFFDGNGTSKPIWDELQRIYTMLWNQAAENLQAKTTDLMFKDAEDWERHVSTFLLIVNELSIKEKALSNAEKVTKILETRSESSASLPVSLSPNEN